MATLTALQKAGFAIDVRHEAEAIVAASKITVREQ